MAALRQARLARNSAQVVEVRRGIMNSKGVAVAAISKIVVGETIYLRWRTGLDQKVTLRLSMTLQCDVERREQPLAL